MKFLHRTADLELDMPATKRLLCTYAVRIMH